MKTLCLVLLVSVFTSLHAQDEVMSKELNNQLENIFNHDYRLNRASKHESRYYIEAISEGKLFAVNADLKGNIISKELVFIIPDEALKLLIDKCPAYKIEDVRKTESAMQLEVLCNDRRMALNISAEGKVTEAK
jgi:hypothetical protein